MNSKTLVQLFQERGVDRYPTDKGTSHSYLPYYDKLFAPFQNKPINLFECGYAKGGSINLWEDYFSNALIIAIDIDDSNFQSHGNHVSLYKENIKSLNASFFDGFPIDIAIDDGSHIESEQIAFVKLIYPILNPGGLLIIEDFQTIEENAELFKSLAPNCEVLDLRKVQGRWDDVLIIYRK